MTGYYKRIVLLLLLVLCFMAALGILKGSVNISFSELLLKENQPILNLRFFRTIIAVITGCGLVVCGIVLQAILRNPLSEPYLLGISSGAGLGAVIAVVIGIAGIYLPLSAFIGALFSIILVYNLARENNKIPEQSLILSGVIVSVACSAIIVFLVSISGNEALHGLTWWLWGSFHVYDPILVSIVTLIVIAGIFLIYMFSQELNAISAGEEEAIHLGIDVENIKKILLAVASLITASLVCISGIIGFVGLIIPHMMRMIIGTNHRRLIPVSCLAAAVFMVTCDILSRVIFPPLEIPVGVITAVLGAPVFIILMKKRGAIPMNKSE